MKAAHSTWKDANGSQSSAAGSSRMWPAGLPISLFSAHRYGVLCRLTALADALYVLNARHPDWCPARWSYHLASAPSPVHSIPALVYCRCCFLATAEAGAAQVMRRRRRLSCCAQRQRMLESDEMWLRTAAQQKLVPVPVAGEKKLREGCAFSLITDYITETLWYCSH